MMSYNLYCLRWLSSRQLMFTAMPVLVNKNQKGLIDFSSWLKWYFFFHKLYSPENENILMLEHIESTCKSAVSPQLFLVSFCRRVFEVLNHDAL